jgi:hypothetical protein
MGATICSTSLSPMPAMRKITVRTARPPARASSTGRTLASNIGCISGGGPGSSTRIRPSASSIWPGAVPRRFGITVAPSITSACFSFTGAITRP